MAIVAVAGWSAFCTFALIKALDATSRVRVSTEEENDGLDLSTHGESAYDHS
jgi:ammonium transporter, Amt family